MQFTLDLYEHLNLYFFSNIKTKNTKTNNTLREERRKRNRQIQL